MLEGTANGRVSETDGDGAEGAGVEFWMPLHDVKRTLRGEGIVMVVDAGYNFAFLGIGVGGDGEMWALGGRMDGFGGRCTWERDGRWVDIGFGLGVGEVSRNGGWIHERDGGGTELCLGRDDLDAVTEDGGVDLDGGRHVVMVWKC